MNKFTATLVASVTALAGLLYSATAGATNLAELPLKASVLAKPNVIFGMDDSGSLDWEVMLATDNGTVWWDYSGKTAWSNDGSLIAADNGSGRDFLAYLFPGSFGSTAPYLDTFNQSWYGIPPTPQFATLRSSDYHKAYFNPDPINTYDDWPPGHNGTTQNDYPPVSIANALASPPSVLAPVKPLSTTTVDLLKDRIARIYMLKGMTVPKGACIENGGTCPTLSADTQMSSSGWAQIPYYPATYWTKVAAADCTATDGSCAAVPGATDVKLKRFEIRRANYASDDAFKKDIQRFANWFTYYRKRVLLMAGSMGKVLETLNGLRVGVVAFNNQSPVTMYDLDSSVNSRNGVRVSGIFYANPASGGTPTQSTFQYIYNQFKRTDAADYAGNKVIQYACQRNAAFIVTDGFYNGSWVTPPTYSRSTWGGSAPYANIINSTMADQALAYYTLNPRTDLPTGRVPLGDTTAANPDLNTNLHVNTYALTLNIPGVIWDGVSTFPSTTFTWPTPATDTRSAIDDIWHATINGRGKMYNVADPREAALKIDAGLRDILSQVSAQGGVAVSSVNLDSTETNDAKAYLGKYNPSGWTGDLEARPINRSTGQIDNSTLSWTDSNGNPATAGSLLAQRNLASDPRIIITANGSATGGGLAFTAGNIGSTVNPDTSKYTNDQVVNYLRGDRTGEGWSGESVIFRRRDLKLGLMGPVVNAEPALDADNKVVYIASGEGMLHAFDTTSGKELWSFVPYDTLSAIGQTVLRGYNFQTKLDGTPSIGKIGTNRKLLVGGMGAGGRAYYALEVSNPRPGDENTAKGMVKWTWPAAGDSNRSLVGYTVGKPLVVRTASNGYVVLVTSGYDNGQSIGDGKGRLWMLDAETGAMLKWYTTTVGTAGDEAGLGHIGAALEADGSVRYVYGGDLKGNVWKFDLEASGTGNTPTLLATLKDASGNAQPVTSAPALVRLNNTRIVLIGTGRILDITDFGSTTTNTFYAIADSGSLPKTRASLEPRTFTRTNATTGDGTVTGNTFDWSSKSGWYMDLPAGEHDNTRPAVAYEAVVFVTNKVGATDCSASSYLYALDIGTGKQADSVSYVSHLLSNTTNATAALVVKLRSGGLKVIGQYYDPITGGKRTYEEDGPSGNTIPAGKNAWREILRQ